MNKSKAISRINKFGKIGRIITVIMLVILSIATAATLAVTIMLKVVPQDLVGIEMGVQASITINPSAVGADDDLSALNSFVEAVKQGEIHGSLNLGSVSLEMEDMEMDGNKLVCQSNTSGRILSLSDIGTTLVFVLISLILTVVSTVFGKRFCKAIEKCDSPFEENVIKKMRHFAYALLPWALFSSVPENITENMFNGTMNYNFSLNINVIFTVLIILALTVVFKYGAVLQQESDETL